MSDVTADGGPDDVQLHTADIRERVPLLMGQLQQRTKLKTSDGDGSERNINWKQECERLKIKCEWSDKWHSHGRIGGTCPPSTCPKRTELGIRPNPTRSCACKIFERLCGDQCQRIFQLEDYIDLQLRQRKDCVIDDRRSLISGRNVTAGSGQPRLERQLPATFEDAFRGIRSVLQRKLDTMHGLLNELLDRRVLLKAHVSDVCQAGKNEYDRVDRLMDVLDRRPDSLLCQFYAALEANDQKDIAQYIKYRGECPVDVEHVTRMAFSENNPVIGLTVLQGRVYVLFCRSTIIAVFGSSAPFTRLPDIIIDDLRCPFDICADHNFPCLYVSDAGGTAIWRIDVNNSGASRWLMGVRALSVSVSRDRQVVLLVPVQREGTMAERSTAWAGEIHVYSWEAALEMVVRLSPDCTSPLYATMSSRNTFIVSHGLQWHRLNRVCEVDITGRVYNAFGSKPGPYTHQLQMPWEVTLDDEERILVADRLNNRVVLLNKQLTLQRVLVTWPTYSARDLVIRPQKLHYDPVTGTLLIGCDSGHIDIYTLK